MAPFAAFYDANVLYPAELRSFLMYLGLTGLFRAKWSNAVHEEWISNLLLDRPDLTREKLERTRMLMDRHAADALVTGYEHLIPELHLPDFDDRHVLAAAIACEAEVIVTRNLKDFPIEILERWGIEAQHPDEFVLSLTALSPELVVSAAHNHRQSMKNPVKSVTEYLATLQRQGLLKTAAILHEHPLFR